MIYWFFGQPGSGKTYTATLFASLHDLPLIEADAFHTEADRRAVAAGTFTLARRHAQLNRIQKHLKQKNIDRAVITHPLPDAASRDLVSGPNSRLIYVWTSPLLHRRRLANRKSHHFTSNLLEAWIARHWEEPAEGSYIRITNEGLKSGIKNQLMRLIQGSQKNKRYGTK